MYSSTPASAAVLVRLPGYTPAASADLVNLSQPPRQRGRIGQAAGIHPRRQCRSELKQVADDDGDRSRKNKHPHHKQIVTQPLAPEGSEEDGAAAQPDRVNEDDQAQLVDQLRQFEIGVERADGEADEQHGSHAQAAPPNLDPPQRIADGGNDEQQQQRIVNQQLNHALTRGPAACTSALTSLAKVLKFSANMPA